VDFILFLTDDIMYMWGVLLALHRSLLSPFSRWRQRPGRGK